MAGRCGQAHNQLIACLFGLAVFGVAAVRPAMAGGCLSYEPAVVTLTGKITEHVAYGPPNYGEDPKHDAKERYIQIDLDHPICVTGTDFNHREDPEMNVQHLELVYYPYPFKKRWLRKHVSIAGTLFHGFTGHHHTQVLATVSETHAIK